MTGSLHNTYNQHPTQHYLQQHTVASLVPSAELTWQIPAVCAAESSIVVAVVEVVEVMGIGVGVVEIGAVDSCSGSVLETAS